MTKDEDAFKAGRKSGMASANAKKRKRKTRKRATAVGGLTMLSVASAIAEASGAAVFRHPLTDSVRITVKRAMAKLGIPQDQRIVNAIAILIASFGLKKVLNSMRLNPEIFRIGGRVFKAV